MRYKKDSIFYIDSFCKRTGCRYDIETGKYIPKEEDIGEFMNRNFSRTLAIFIKYGYDVTKWEF